MTLLDRLHAVNRASSFESRWQREASPSLDPQALAVWERMPSEHRDWARRAATQHVVAEHPHHARILADLGSQFRRHRQRLAAWVVVPLLILAALQAEAVLVDPANLGPWLLIGFPALGATILLLGDRRLRRTIRANERLADMVIVVPEMVEPVRTVDLEDLDGRVAVI